MPNFIYLYFREGPKNGGGLPRHNFNGDPFFPEQQVPNPFRDFDRYRRFGGSNSRLFDDDFFDTFANGSGFGTEPSFFRSSLPRRHPGPPPSSGFEHPIHINRQTTPQPSPSMHRKVNKKKFLIK